MSLEKPIDNDGDVEAPKKKNTTSEVEPGNLREKSIRTPWAFSKSTFKRIRNLMKKEPKSG